MSFSTRIKQDILSLKFKNKCCKKAFLYGALFGANLSDGIITMKLSDPETSDFITYILSTVFKIKEVDITETKRGFCNIITLKFSLPTAENLLSEVDSGADTESYFKEIFACNSCIFYFFGGLFCSSGTMSDPTKSYFLELAIPTQKRAEKTKEILESHSALSPGMTKRKNGYGLFFRNAEAVTEFLMMCQLSVAVFDFVNQQGINEMRGNANRVTNCEAQNILRTVSACASQIQAIKKLRSNGKLYKLSPELQTTAELREENPEMSLAKLALLHTPPITKSGLNNRIAKIMKDAQEE